MILCDLDLATVFPMVMLIENNHFISLMCFHYLCIGNIVRSLHLAQSFEPLGHLEIKNNYLIIEGLCSFRWNWLDNPEISVRRNKNTRSRRYK